jgi:hypothetical protein
MKIFLIILLTSGCVSNKILSQSINSPEKCPTFEKINLKAFIAGQKDTLINNDKVVQFIEPLSLINGFQLQTEDTTYKIIRFHFSFDFEEGITEIVSTGSKIIPRNDSIVAIKKLTEAKLITIDNIIAAKNNFCYRIPSLVYYTFKK